MFSLADDYMMLDGNCEECSEEYLMRLGLLLFLVWLNK